MPLKAMYNSIAAQYNTANCFGASSESHKCAIEQSTREH